MRLRFASLLLLLSLHASGAQPLLLQPEEWVDAPAILRRASAAMETPVAKPGEQGGPALTQFADTVELLAVAAVRSGSVEFSNRAGDWIRVWIVDPATRLDPSAVGGPDGTAFLDAGRNILRVVDAVRILEGSTALSEADELAVRAWLADRYAWLANSGPAAAEAKLEDHRGTWYLVQAITLATHLDAEPDIQGLCERARRLAGLQFARDGSQPLEIPHEDGLSDSILNLEGHLHIAFLASKKNMDLWNDVPENGGGLRAGLEFLRPFNDKPESWPHSQRTQVPPGALARALSISGKLSAKLEAE